MGGWSAIAICLTLASVARGFSENFWDDDLNDLDGNYSAALRFPGTKWCGPGSDARNFEDLGSLTKVDKCCRAHDNCDHIEKGQEKHGLVNSFSYSKLHCRCDREFRDCLKLVGSKYANTVGRLYFSWQDRCYKREFPQVKCARKSWSFMGKRCMSYQVDTTSPMRYQWFDLPYYQDSGSYDAFRGV